MTRPMSACATQWGQGWAATGVGAPPLLLVVPTSPPALWLAAAASARCTSPHGSRSKYRSGRGGMKATGCTRLVVAAVDFRTASAPPRSPAHVAAACRYTGLPLRSAFTITLAAGVLQLPRRRGEATPTVLATAVSATTAAAAAAAATHAGAAGVAHRAAIPRPACSTSNSNSTSSSKPSCQSKGMLDRRSRSTSLGSLLGNVLSTISTSIPPLALSHRLSIVGFREPSAL